MLNNVSLRQSVAAAHQHDFMVNASFWPEQLDKQDLLPFQIPITCFWGMNDRIVSLPEVKDWQKFTTVKFSIVLYPEAGHMLVTEKGEDMMKNIHGTLLSQ